MSLKVINLSKSSDQKWILRDVSFEVARGEVFGLFGASDAGKTTALRSIAGLENGGGTIEFDAKDITKASPDTRNFYFSATPEESIWRKFVKSNKSSALSDGERQTVAIENALITDKDVLLLDNSFCSMDVGRKQEYFGKLRRIVKEKGVAVVFAANNFDDILMFCDRAAVLSGSNIQQTGTPQDIYDNPETLAVAKLTGRNNLFEARRLTSSKADIPQYQSIEGEHRLTVQKVERSGLAPLNQNLYLGIRPEHISITFGASFPEDNLIKATVTGVRFLGANTLVELDANGLKLNTLVLRLVGLNIGEECMLGLPPDRIRVFRR